MAGYLDRIIAVLKEALGSEQIDFSGHGPHAHCFEDRHMGSDRRGREDFWNLYRGGNHR